MFVIGLEMMLQVVGWTLTLVVVASHTLLQAAGAVPFPLIAMVIVCLMAVPHLRGKSFIQTSDLEKILRIVRKMNVYPKESVWPGEDKTGFSLYLPDFGTMDYYSEELNSTLLEEILVVMLPNRSQVTYCFYNGIVGRCHRSALHSVWYYLKHFDEITPEESAAANKLREQARNRVAQYSPGSIH